MQELHSIVETGGEYRPIQSDAGDAAPAITVPAQLAPRRAVRLADGSLCANAADGTSQGGVWTVNAEGRQFLAPQPFVDLVFRAPDGGCYAISQGAVFHAQGDVVEWRARLERPSFGADDGYAPDRNGGLWAVGKKFRPGRVLLGKEGVKTTYYPLPEKIAGFDCPTPTARRVAAVDETDVWVVASCRDAEGKFLDDRPLVLLHTGAARRVFDWPSP